jgi:putative membrane protein
MPICGPWLSGWFVFPIIGLVLMVVALLLVFGPRGPFAHFGGRGGWGAPPERTAPGGESALEVLKLRYARGELTREQFEEMRRDVA